MVQHGFDYGVLAVQVQAAPGGCELVNVAGPAGQGGGASQACQGAFGLLDALVDGAAGGQPFAHADQAVAVGLGEFLAAFVGGIEFG